MGCGVGVKRVEVNYTQVKLVIGQELDRFGFGASRKQDKDIFFDRPLLQQASENPSALKSFAQDTVRMRYRS